MARFALAALHSCRRIVDARFQTDEARALFAGCAAHSFLPLDDIASGSFGLMLALSGHAVGWPCAVGGSGKIVDALVAKLYELGGVVQTNTPIQTLNELPRTRAILFDLTPRQILALAGDHLPSSYKKSLANYKCGPGVFKVDWALRAPIPWKNSECREAATVHVGGTFEEIAASEAATWTKRPDEKPFVLVAQQSLFDSTRAPAGKHTGWAYCHVPNGCAEDMTERIEKQVERFAPGFRDIILARHTTPPNAYHAYNPNLIGGDICGGANTLRQTIFRPVARWDPFSTPNPRLFICSSSTPPGGGVHGMCGYWAAHSALRRVFKKQKPPT